MTDATLTAETVAPAAAAPASVPAPAPAAATPAPAPVTATPAVAPAESPAAAAAAASPAPAGAPEKYEFKAPEGASAFDDTVLGAYGDAARELNLTQEGAQALLTKVGPVIQAQQVAKLTEFYSDIGGLPDTWATQVQADKELGGADMDAKLAVAAKARDLGGPEFVKMLNKTGMGNHPEMIRTFYRIGKSLSEDKFVQGGTASSASRTRADIMYPTKP